MLALGGLFVDSLSTRLVRCCNAYRVQCTMLALLPSPSGMNSPLMVMNEEYVEHGYELFE